MNPLMPPNAVPKAPPPEDLPLLVPHVRVLTPLFVDPADQSQAWTHLHIDMLDSSKKSNMLHMYIANPIQLDQFLLNHVHIVYL